MIGSETAGEKTLNAEKAAPPLHDLSLKYSSCFFGSFPLGHFIIDNICHRPAAALFDVNLGPEELGDQDKITSGSEKLSLVSTALCTRGTD